MAVADLFCEAAAVGAAGTSYPTKSVMRARGQQLRSAGEAMRTDLEARTPADSHPGSNPRISNHSRMTAARLEQRWRDLRSSGLQPACHPRGSGKV
ncbi:hypothetical protein [Streptomyces sp. NPDC057418]|uniref:hypothetical protein n=1 Tax=Streptomyces sp. NPDC057418 TaxID=3346126 RepID=UPI003699E19F